MGIIDLAERPPPSSTFANRRRGRSRRDRYVDEYSRGGEGGDGHDGLKIINVWAHCSSPMKQTIVWHWVAFLLRVKRPRYNCHGSIKLIFKA
jgi:hypothetical protein